MFASQYISNEIFPLKKCDDAETASMFMDDWKVSELPVVDNLKVMGLVTQSALLNNNDKKVEEFMQTDSSFYCIQENVHLFEINRIFSLYKLSTLAVINDSGNFKGIISNKDIALQSFFGSSIMQEGAILILQIQAIHYSVAEIARICESNEAKIIHLMVEPIKDEENNLLVSLKLNKKFLSHVIASLERFNYIVIYTNSELDSNQSMDSRYQWLLKYLNT